MGDALSSAADAGVATAFYRVMHMLDEPRALCQPHMMARVLARSLARGRPLAPVGATAWGRLKTADGWHQVGLRNGSSSAAS